MGTPIRSEPKTLGPDPVPSSATGYAALLAGLMARPNASKPHVSLSLDAWVCFLAALVGTVWIVVHAKN